MPTNNTLNTTLCVLTFSRTN